MPIEQRVISGPKIGAKIGGGSSSSSSAPAPEDEPRKRRPRRVVLLVVVVVVLLAAGAAAYFLLVKGGETEPAAPPPPEPGAVLTVDPVSVNLADGHYLRLGLALQLTAESHETPDTARALDLAIALFSGRSIEEVSDPAMREQLKTELAGQLAEAYEGEVMDVYLTNYVTQ